MGRIGGGNSEKDLAAKDIGEYVPISRRNLLGDTKYRPTNAKKDRRNQGGDQKARGAKVIEIHDSGRELICVTLHTGHPCTASSPLKDMGARNVDGDPTLRPPPP